MHEVRFNVLQNSGWGENMLKRLDNFRCKSTLCDVVVKGAEGRVNKAHRAILAATSSVFLDLFENVHDSNELIIETYIDDKILTLIIEFLYSGRVVVEKNDLQHFVESCKYFEINIQNALVSNILRRKNFQTSDCTSLNLDLSNNSQNVTLSDQSWSAHVLKSLNDLRFRHLLCDVKIKGLSSADSSEVYAAHRVTLAAASPTFMRLFDNVNAIYELIVETHFDGEEVLVPLVEFVYSGQAQVLKDKMDAFDDACQYFEANHIMESASSVGGGEGVLFEKESPAFTTMELPLEEGSSFIVEQDKVVVDEDLVLFANGALPGVIDESQAVSHDEKCSAEDDTVGALCQIVNATNFAAKKRNSKTREPRKTPGFHNGKQFTQVDKVTYQPVESENDLEHCSVIDELDARVSGNGAKTKKHKCLVCGKFFSRRHHLQDHMGTVHCTERLFVCDRCPAAFKALFQLKRHFGTHVEHGVAKSNICEECGRQFACGSGLRRHMLSHTGAQRCVCPVCSRAFINRENRKRHMDVAHSSDSKKYLCTDCGQCFAYRNSLRGHMLTHTGERLLRCTVCGKQFGRKANLAKHTLTHTGQRNYKCSVCQRFFVQKSALNRHMCIHTGLRRFKCELCEKRFIDGHGLKDHMLSHTGDKEFGCEQCGKKFGRKPHLKRHMDICKGSRKKLQSHEEGNRGLQRTNREGGRRRRGTFMLKYVHE